MIRQRNNILRTVAQWRNAILILVVPLEQGSTLFPYTTLFRSKDEPITNDVVMLTGTLTSDFLNKTRSEEHTSELQSQFYVVCRLSLETKIFALSALDRDWDLNSCAEEFLLLVADEAQRGGAFA